MAKLKSAKALIAMFLLAFAFAGGALAISSRGIEAIPSSGSGVTSTTCSQFQFVDVMDLPSNCDYAPQFNTTSLNLFLPITENGGTILLDLSGNSHNGRALNNPAWTSSCIYSLPCLSFTGSSFQSVSIAGFSYNPLNDFSIAFWDAYTLSTLHNIMFSCGSSSTPTQTWSIRTISGVLNFISGVGNITGPALTLNKFYNIGLSITASVGGGNQVVSLYVDGDSVGTLTTSGPEHSANCFMDDLFGAPSSAWYGYNQQNTVLSYGGILSESMFYQVYETEPYPFEFQFNLMKFQIPQAPFNSTGLQLYYPLDELAGTNAYDLSGSGATAAYSATPPAQTTAASCKFGNCLTFTGASSEAATTSATISFPVSSGYMSFWYLQTANVGATQWIFGSTGSSDGMELNASNQPTCSINFVTLGVQTLSGGANSLNVWHSIICTWKLVAGSTTMTLYVDNVVAATKTVAASPATDSHAWAIGGKSGEYYTGRLDDLRLDTASLTAQYAAQLYFGLPLPFEVQYNALGTTCSAGEYLSQNNIPSSCSNPPTNFQSNSKSCTSAAILTEMAGFKLNYTASGTGNIYVTVNFQVALANATTNSLSYKLAWGTGSAPACAAALTGTVVGNTYSVVGMQNHGVELVESVSETVVISGVSGTIWVDEQLSNNSGASITVSIPQMSVIES